MRASSSSSSFAVVVLGIVASFGAIACTSADVGTTENGGGEGDEVAATDAEVRASCTSPRLYYAALRTACTTIQGRSGRWVPEPIFADTPDDPKIGTCAFRWVGTRYSRPDREALTSSVTWESGLTPACGTSSEPAIGQIKEIPALDVFGYAGSVGCDVCGWRIRKDQIRVILPPEKIGARQFMVPLSNGGAKYFEIEPSNSRALSLQLPPPPPGTTYDTGRIHIY